jgi:hypothetical protein
MRKLSVVALLLGVTMLVFSQSDPSHAPSGSLAGKLTDLHSKPVGGATVVVRNQSTGTEARTTTTKNGTYRFLQLQPGAYTLVAESEQLGRGEIEEIVVDAGHEARVQTAMEFEPAAAGTVLAKTPSPELQRAARPEIQAQFPTVRDAARVAEPARLLSIAGRRLAEQPRGMPSTETPVLDAALQPEPMETLALEGHWWMFKPRETPQTQDPVLVAALPVVALESLSMPVRDGLNPVRSPLAVSNPVSSSKGVQQAGETAQTQPSPPVLLASESSGPAASAVTTTMTAAQLQAMPVSGRRWEEFVLDSAPTASTPSGGQGQTSLRGAGTQAAAIAVDGAPAELAFGRSGSSGNGSSGGSQREPAGMARVWAGGRGFALSEAAIREVQTVSGNVEAEAARAAGGRMNLETQSGANGLHGQGFLFDRQNVWGAQNPFTQWVKETAPATATTTPVFTAEPYTPSDREATWGIGLGRHIRRDKLFWFAAVDGYRRDDPGVSTVKHFDQFFAQPDADQMLALSARLGASSNPLPAGIAAYSTKLESLAGLLGPAPRTATQWTGFGRLDWEAAERHRFTLEGIGARWNSPGGGLTRVSEAYGNHSFGSSQASEEWLLGRWEAFLTPNLLAVTQASAGRTIQQAHPDTPSTFEQGFLRGNAWGQLPQMVVDSRYGFTIGNPSRFGAGSYPDERLYQMQEGVDWVRGKVLVKAGFEVSHNADVTSLLRNQTGAYHYANVENFISDVLAFSNFGLAGQLSPVDQHNCDQTGKVWRDAAGTLRGVGDLPCYSYYTQTLGPSDWHLSTTDWAGYATAQWQPHRLVVLSAGLRWEREQLPPPIASLSNSDLPLTQKLPGLGNNWGPRFSMALGKSESRWPVLRLGYGMYSSRTQNATLETALTQTGSLKGDLNFFMRPTFDLPNYGGGAPPFPYVLAGEPSAAVKPGAVEFASNFRNPQVHQGIAALEESLPAHIELTGSAVVSLGRHLPVSVDTNYDPAVNPGTITYRVVDPDGLGPLKASRITVPFYASWPFADCPGSTPLNIAGECGRLHPNYQQIAEIFSRANSTYEAGTIKVVRYGRRGLSLRAHYTYSHAVDWNPNDSAQVAGSDVLDPADFSLEYGVSNLDVRHSAAIMATWEPPWKLHNLAGRLGNGWMITGVGQFRSGLPYTMRTEGSLAAGFGTTGATIEALAPGMNGSGGDNRVYGVGDDKRAYNIGRNTFRYPSTWKADLRLAKRFNLGAMRQLELLAESFNLFNHQNVTQLETTGYSIERGSSLGDPSTLTFLNGAKANTTAFGQPLNINATDFYRERQIQFGLRIRF